MTNQHTKTNSTLSVITMRYYLIPPRTGVLIKTVTNADENVENWNPHTLLSGNVKWYSHFGK